MKKLRLFAFLLMASTAVSTFSPRVVAQTEKDCPPIPETVKTVVVSKDDVALRTTSQKLDNPSNIVVLAKLNESLEVFNHKPTKNQYCWYEVKTPEGRTKAKQEALWVAKENLLPFDSIATPTPSPTLFPKNSPSSSPKTSPSGTSNTQQSPQSNFLAILNPYGSLLNPYRSLQETVNPDKDKIDYLSLFWTILTSFVTISFVPGLVAVAYVFYKLKEEINGLKNTINTVKNNHEKEEEDKPPSSKVSKVNQLNAKIKKLEHETHTDNIRISEIYKALNENQVQFKIIHESLNNLQSQVLEIKTVLPIPPVPHVTIVDSTKQTTKIDEETDKEIDKIISKFNSQDKLYFDDSRFHPVKLSRVSIDGKVGLDARRTIRFEPAEPSQEAYLEFSADGENWLIPNITSPSFNKLLNQLLENPEIFTVNKGSGNSQLVDAIKLKSVGIGIWEILEFGKFGDKTS